MNTSRVLTVSVNPAAATIGSLYPEVCVNSLRRKVDLEGATLARQKSGATLRLLFGTTSFSSFLSSLILAIRVVGSSMLFYYGLRCFAMSPVVGILSIAIGMSLIFGFAMRMITFVAAIGFGIFSYHLIESGMMPNDIMTISLGCLIMSAAGPGRYSADAIMRRGIFRKIRRYETRKLMENRFSYRAYQYATEY